MYNKTKVKRVPKRGHYDKETIYSILDRGMYCHVAFIHNDGPVVIPTAYGRCGDFIYIHGSTASRMMRTLSDGLEVCVSVTTLTGLVLAKSAFHHSMNYESVVLFGKAMLIESNEDKMTALKSFTDHIIPGRWEEARQPNDKELKGTMVLKLALDQVSAKIRAEGVNDDKEDQNLDIWTGVLPFVTTIGEPIFIDQQQKTAIPPSVANVLRKVV